MTNDPLFIAGMLACAAVVVILLLGINAFRKGGVEGSKKSNKLMQWRLGMQLVAIILLLLFAYFVQDNIG